MYHEGRWFTWFIGDLYWGNLEASKEEILLRSFQSWYLNWSSFTPAFFSHFGGELYFLYIYFLSPQISFRRDPNLTISPMDPGDDSNILWRIWDDIPEVIPSSKFTFAGHLFFWWKKLYFKRCQCLVLFWVQRKTSTNLNLQNSVLKLKLVSIFDAFFVEILGMIPTGCVF